MGNNKNLSSEEKARLKELIALKKAGKLDDSAKKELEALNAKCGFKPQKKMEKRDRGSSDFKPGNDFSWWNKLPDLLKDAANYKCNYIAGDPISEGAIEYVVPGVLALGVIPSYGVSYKKTDPLNVWARNLYLKMFQKYRVANGYSAADLGITLIATIEVIKIVAWYERVYGVINRYSKLNLNMPDVEIRALGLSDTVADYLRSHLSDFRYDLNELIARMQRITIMKDVSEISNAISLFGYEYLDHDSIRSQIILFKPAYVGYYDEEEMVAGNIRFEEVVNTEHGYDQFFNTNPSETENMCTVLDEQLSALLGSDSVQKIYADLVTWFGEGAMIQFSPVPEDYTVVPVKSDSILHKLHNAEIYNDPHIVSVYPGTSEFPDTEKQAVSNQYRIYQYKDTIMSGFGFNNRTGNTFAISLPNQLSINGSVNFETPHIHAGHMVDTYHEDVDVETITEGVLFKCDAERVHAKQGNTDYSAHVIKSCDFDILVRAQLFSNDGVKYDLDVINDVDDGTMWGSAGLLSVIDWAPLCYSVNSGSGVIEEVGGDVDNVVPLSLNGLFKLQRTILYSGLQTDATVIKN